MCVVVDFTAFVDLSRRGQKSTVLSSSCVGMHVAGAIEDSAHGKGSLALLSRTEPTTIRYSSDVEIVDSLANGE